ncbi:MAG: hypothetical protein IH852_16005 [Bacteroidetes bacterium]|nr:hypothetical protein [Bacteroidota bacterium]
MKKGCFLKFIIIFTIVLAVILYLVQNKFDELFLEPGKEIILTAIEDSWNTELEYVKDSIEKDSLKSLLRFYVSGIQSSDYLPDKRTETVINYLEQTFQDSLIDIEELSHINKLIKYALKNEE